MKLSNIHFAKHPLQPTIDFFVQFVDPSNFLHNLFFINIAIICRLCIVLIPLHFIHISIISLLKGIVDFFSIRRTIEFLSVKAAILIIAIIFTLVVGNSLFLFLMVLISSKIYFLCLLHRLISQIRFIPFHSLILYTSLYCRCRTSSSPLPMLLLHSFRFIG